MKPDALILAFDTSAAHVVAALLSGDQVLAQRTEPMAKGQAERLFPLLEGLLTEAGKSWADLTAIGVGIGPGNFTGIRISVSAARGLALSLNIPAVGVSSFEAQAHGLPRPIQSILDARRGQVYVQELRADSASDPRLIAAEDTANLPSIGPSETVDVVAIAQITQHRHTNPSLPRPAPLYVRAPDAAPPRDPAPVILP